MMESKQEFIKSFLPDTVDSLELTQINLDITDLGVADVLRNLNTIYPQNSRNRSLIQSGRMVVGVLCKTRTLEPLSGIFILITGDQIQLKLLSVNYLVFCIPESQITDKVKLANIVYKLTDYIAKSYGKEIENLPIFYRKFIYDKAELDDDDDDSDDDDD